MFQNLRANSQLYILHKDGIPRVECGTVTRPGSPRTKYPSIPTPAGQIPQLETVVDIVASINGQETSLQGLPAGAEIADFGQNGNIVVSCSRDAMNNEIALMRKKSEDVLKSVAMNQSIIEACDKMLDQLNPEFAEKQRRDKEMEEMKIRMSEMTRSISDLMEVNKKLMERLDLDSGTKAKN